MQTLLKEGDLEFRHTTVFDFRFLAPVGAFVSWKLENGWDDYNELYHAAAFFEYVRHTPNLRTESHLMVHGGHLAGVVFFIGGNIGALENKYPVHNEPGSLLLKYFHILNNHRGYGRKWLTEIIFPFYRAQGIENIYVNSSHPGSFSLYEKLGRQIATYRIKSDNACFDRDGRCYMVDL